MVKDKIKEISSKNEFDRTVLEDIEMGIWLRGYKAVYESGIKTYYQVETAVPTFEDFIKSYVNTYMIGVFKTDDLFIKYFEKELKEDYKKYYGIEV